MDRRLRARDVRATLVSSVDEATGTGLLDVLPAGATKLHAVEFVRTRLGFAAEHVVYAGDSGNDLPVLTSGVPAVLVANAADDVRAMALELARAAGHERALYLARGGHLGMNGNYCAGVLEGVAHYRPELVADTMRGASS